MGIWHIDGALIRLTTPVQGDAAKARLDGFLGELAPVLPGFIRDDQKF